MNVEMKVYIRGVQIRSDRIRSGFGTKIYISDRIDKVVSQSDRIRLRYSK
jgi:hypothetical protein